MANQMAVTDHPAGSQVVKSLAVLQNQLGSWQRHIVEIREQLSGIDAPIRLNLKVENTDHGPRATLLVITTGLGKDKVVEQLVRDNITGLPAEDTRARLLSKRDVQFKGSLWLRLAIVLEPPEDESIQIIYLVGRPYY